MGIHLRNTITKDSLNLLKDGKNGKEQTEHQLLLNYCQWIHQRIQERRRKVDKDLDKTDTLLKPRGGMVKEIVKLVNIQRHLFHLEDQYNRIKNNISAEELESEH